MDINKFDTVKKERQPFFGQVIDDRESLGRIRAYIRDNPKQREEEDYFLGNNDL